MCFINISNVVPTIGVLSAYPTVNAMGFSGSPQRPNGMAMYSSLTLLTGGELILINGMIATQDLQSQLSSQLIEMVVGATACDAKMKVRTSRGVRFSEYIGKGYLDSVEDVVEVCGYSKHDSFAFFLKHEGTRYLEASCPPAQ